MSEQRGEFVIEAQLNKEQAAVLTKAVADIAARFQIETNNYGYFCNAIAEFLMEKTIAAREFDNFLNRIRDLPDKERRTLFEAACVWRDQTGVRS